MAAEIIEKEALEAAQTNDLPQDTEAMTPDELIQEFEGQDTTAPQEPPSVEDDLPDKYRGKSIKEIVSMHQEAERALGRQGSEVGELRQVVDQYIRGQAAQQAQAAQEPQEEVDFFENPEAAVSRAIENHPTVKQAAAQSQQTAQQAALQQVATKHPDMREILADPAFANWVQSSPVRTELFVRADQKYDYNCADELLSTWKERNQVAQQAQVAEQQQRKQAVARASTGGGSGANTSGAKKVYRRADIIKLMKNDPDRYEALSGEIMQAYAEGRVR